MIRACSTRPSPCFGGQVVSLPAEGAPLLGRGRAVRRWHRRHRLKVALYLGPVTAATGAQGLLPLSHRRVVGQMLERYRADQRVPVAPDRPPTT
jgi:hypothetical protein